MARDKQLLYGFHAVTARLRHASTSVRELYVDPSRRDKRMQEFMRRAESLGIAALMADSRRLDALAGTDRHQGVVALVDPMRMPVDVDEVLDTIEVPPLLLVLDSITDPRNLGACLRVADGAGVHAVIAPRDRAVGVDALVARTASGAAESVPFIAVTNLARTLRSLKERDIRIVGAADESAGDLYRCDLKGPLAMVMGAEGEGMRRLTREHCDELVRIPMLGSVESLNVAVASGIVLYEAVRQRSH
ncbi:23S rRNA (guanosine(2251)-2'-O)-methyltransferase RlmB [soil metagenome]